MALTCKSRCLLTGVALLMAMTTRSASAWTTDGVQVVDIPNIHSIGELKTLPDGSGGVWIVWSDNRSGNYDIYLQRLNSSGAKQLGSTGTAVCVAAGDQRYPRIAADPTGGVVICWQDYRNSGTSGADIYCQHMTSSGGIASGWPTDGLGAAVTTAAGDQLSPSIVATGTTDAIVFYDDTNSFPTQQTLATRMSGSGRVWTKLVYGGGWDTDSPIDISSDLSGGAVCTFQAGPDGDLLAQHVDASGNLLLTNPFVVSTTGTHPKIAYDNFGGAYIAYHQLGSGNDLDVEAVHFDSGGHLAQVFQGSAAGNQSNPLIVAGPEGDAFMAWNDDRNCQIQNCSGDFYAARLSLNSLCSGWLADGIRVTDAASIRQDLALAPTGDGGGMLVWSEGGDIYARRVRPNATLENLITLCSATGSQTGPSVSLTANGVVSAAWVDGRFITPPTPPTDIYAQQGSFTPVPGLTTATIGTVAALGIDVHWTVPSADPVFGTPVKFDVRVLHGTVTEQNFESDPEVTVINATAPGTAMCATAAVLHRCYTYQFGIRTQYACGAWSLLSNLPFASTLCSGNSIPDCGGGFMTATLPDDGSGAPAQLEFAAPRPNPTQASAQFRIGIPSGAQGEELRLAVFDAGGRRVRQLSQSTAAAGWQSVEWDLRDDAGKRVPGGVYFAHLVAGGQRLARTLIVKP